MEDRNRLLQEQLQKQAEETEQALQEDWSVFPDLDTEEFAAGISNRKARERILNEPDYREAQLLLFKAAAMGDGDLVELALARGADPTLSFHGNTPAHYAAAACSPTHSGDTSALKVLLKAGADPNARNSRGETPLHVAAWSGNPQAIHLLLDAGADPTLKDKMGRTPIELAHRRGMAEACQILGTAMINRRQISMKDYNLALHLMPRPPETAKKAVSRGVGVTLGGVACLVGAMALSGCSGGATDVSYVGKSWQGDPINVLEEEKIVLKPYEVKVASFEDPFAKQIREYQPRLFWNRDGIVIEEIPGTEPRFTGEGWISDSGTGDEVADFLNQGNAACAAENTPAGQDPDFQGSYPLLAEGQDFQVYRAVRGDTWWGLSRRENLNLDSLANLNAFGSRTKSKILSGKLSVGEKMWFVSGNANSQGALYIEYCNTEYSQAPDSLEIPAGIREKNFVESGIETPAEKQDFVALENQEDIFAKFIEIKVSENLGSLIATYSADPLAVNTGCAEEVVANSGDPAQDSVQESGLALETELGATLQVTRCPREEYRSPDLIFEPGILL